jgi:hypothetical protein
MMRISLRDCHGKELDFASVVDGRDAPAEAMLLLARRARLEPGDLLFVDDDSTRQEPGLPMTLTDGNLRSLAGRLEQRAGALLPLNRCLPRICGRPRAFAGTRSRPGGWEKPAS